MFLSKTQRKEIDVIKDKPGIILENALRLFGEKGYESTTVDEIAVSIRYGAS
ncbi:TetR/AcrR family transcriptional regulator [Paenibacillus sp. alder61]|uniref:Helix-turn-helix transcriptional regulator n=1 Tax=Paenibacillus faecis TaxID=862114 RepID=A0A5D0CXY8_9BACL|nr:TetR/AcrR family transcriptional regulator [Paenibacillus sp. alder61]TYA14618.1 helix-turn-helix transcriptional regulator [Paenibacillus faecis]